ncbi:MAG: SPASM domain-containing protein [Saprospiraceae bacterium]
MSSPGTDWWFLLFDKDATHQLGDLKDLSFEKIWKDKPYQNFRQQL